MPPTHPPGLRRVVPFVGSTARRIRDVVEPAAPRHPPRVDRIAGHRGIPVLGTHLAALCARLSDKALGARQWHLARGFAELAIAARPAAADGWVALSRSCRLGGCTGIAHDDVRGLEVTATGDAVSASRASAEAVRLGSERSDCWLEHARVLLDLGQVDDAKTSLDRALLLSPTQTRLWYERARLEARSADRRGYFTDAEFDRHRECAARALELDATHTHARYHLIRVALRAADWQSALDAAARSDEVTGPIRNVFDRPPSSDEVDELLELAGCEERALAVQPDVWLVVFWRLLDLGRVPAAFAAKDACARGTLARTHPAGTPSTVVTRVRALSTLGEHDAALDELVGSIGRRPGRRVEATMRKLQSDVLYSCGETGAHVVDSQSARLGPAEQAFDRLVRGRRIAVVGPTAATGDDPDLGDFDIVIRPKSLGAANGDAGRTDISYFATAGARVLDDRIAEALARRQLRLAVLRPSLHGRLSSVLAERADVRLAPTENAALLEASSYAVPRIVYDVLRYGPGRVTVFSTNFFTDGLRYDGGYHIDRVRDQDFVERVTGYGHDLRADHAAMSNLRRTGAIDVDDEVAGILDLAGPAYLERVATGRQSTERSARP